MIILLLPYAEAHVQQVVIKRLSILLELSPCNKRALCQMQVLSTLLRLIPKFEDDVQNYYLQLVASLGLYDIGSEELRLLFDLASLPPKAMLHALKSQPSTASSSSSLSLSLRRCEEIQMQLLYVIGRLTERMAPPSFFHFDGATSSLDLEPLSRFPASKVGFSFCCWLQINALLGSESSLFSMEDSTGNVMFELMFQPSQPELQAQAQSQDQSSHSSVSGAWMTLHAPQTRTLAIRTMDRVIQLSTSGLESRGWHHFALMHNRSSLSIFVDGILRHKFNFNSPASVPSASSPSASIISLAYALAYPTASFTPSKSSPLLCRVARTPPASPLASSLCGAMGTIYLLEGSLEEKHVQMIHAEGTLFRGDLKHLGIHHKRIMVVHPHEFAVGQPCSSSPPDSPLASKRDYSSLVMTPLFLDSTRAMKLTGGDDNEGLSPRVRSGYATPARHRRTRLVRNSGDTFDDITMSSEAKSKDKEEKETKGSKTRKTPIVTEAELRRQLRRHQRKLRQQRREGRMKHEEDETRLDDAFSDGERELSPLSDEDSDFGSGVFVPPASLSPPAALSEEKERERGGSVLQKSELIRASVDVHVTRCIKEEIRSVGGIQLCLPFLTMGGAQQVAALRILGGFMEQCRENVRAFEKMQAFAVLGHLLSDSHSELTRETFDVLMELTSGRCSISWSQRRLTHSGGVWLMLDLLRLPQCDLITRKQVVESMVQVALNPEVPSNLQAWRDGPGVVTIIELLRLSPAADLFPPLLRLLEAMFPVLRSDEFEVLLHWLIVEAEEPSLQSERSELCHALTLAMSRHPVLLQALYKAGGIDLLFLLLRSPSAPIRVDCLRILGYLFDLHPKTVLSFTKSGGYDVLRSLLARYPPSQAIMAGLLELAYGNFKCQEQSVATPSHASTLSAPSTNVPRAASEKKSGEPKLLVHPLMIRVMVQLLGDALVGISVATLGAGPMLAALGASSSSDSSALNADPSFQPSFDPTLHIECLGQIERLFDRTENIDCLLDTDWMLWCAHYLACLQVYSVRAASSASPIAASSALPSSPPISIPTAIQRTLAKLHHTLQKSVIRDLQRSHRVCRLSKVREMTDMQDFQLAFLMLLVQHFEDHPILEKSVTTNVLRNLVHLLEDVESWVSLPPRLCARIINAINLMASQNDSEVRSKMQDHQIFNIRDNLVMYCIRQDMHVDERLESFRTFSFEIVASHPKYRESSLLYMLKILHECHDVRLQLLIVDVLRSQLGAHEENRRMFLKIMQDHHVIRLLFPHMSVEDLVGRGWAGCFPSPSTPDEEKKSLDLVSSSADGQSSIGEAQMVPAHLESNEWPWDDSLEEWVAWYFSPAQSDRLQAIHSRIDKALHPIDNAFRKFTAKIVERKMKNFKYRIDKTTKTAKEQVRLTADIMDKATRLLDKISRGFAARQQKAIDARLERARVGDESWKKIRAALELMQIPVMMWNSKKETEKEPENDQDKSEAREEKEGEVSSTPAALASSASDAQSDSIDHASPISVSDTDSTLPVQAGSLTHGASSSSCSSMSSSSLSSSAQLHCPLCSQTFLTRWDCICHTRLDHQRSERLRSSSGSSGYITPS